MNNFLHGFADELVKVGAVSSMSGTNYMRDTGTKPLPAPGSGQAKPPAPPKPTGGSAPAPASTTPKQLQPQSGIAASAGGAKIPKSFGNPRNIMSTIGNQRMDLTNKPAKPGRYRESPAGPNISAVTTPTEAPKKTGGGGRKSKGDGAVLEPRRRLPGERLDDMHKREAGEAGYNKKLQAKKALGSRYNTAAGRYGTSNAPQPHQISTIKGQGWNAPEVKFDNRTGKKISGKNLQTPEMRQAATTMSKLRPG